MKTLLVLAPLFVLASCSRQPVEPTGIYRLSTQEKMVVLEVRASGDYILQIDRSGSMTDEIRGRWQDERGAEVDVTFHGIVWHGNTPEAAAGFWAVAFERDGGICLDGKELLCFTKDAAA
jgi:hypothetical protein